MKVYISVDMEGIACVTHFDHIKLEGGAYEAARKWTTAEANAAIEGAFEGGADEIVVSDGHGTAQNLIPDELHEDITLVQGIPRPLLMMEGLDETFDAVFFIGYHARAGNPVGTLAHSFSGRLVHEIRLNQDPVSEAIFNAAVAGHFEVPIALISGDDELAVEIEKKLPWVERVVTNGPLVVLRLEISLRKLLKRKLGLLRRLPSRTLKAKNILLYLLQFVLRSISSPHRMHILLLTFQGSRGKVVFRSVSLVQT